MATAKDKTARKLTYGTNAVIGTVLFAIILIGLNYLASRANWRVDMTRNGLYTVSTATDGILGGLKDHVTVTVYATAQNTPSSWTEQRNQLRDLLREYRIKSGGKVRFVFKDPTDNPELEREAEQAGVNRQLMTQQSATELSAREGYLGFTILYKDKNETVPVIRPDYPLEYQLTSAINKIAQVKIPKVGLLAPGGNPFTMDPGPFNLVPQFLEQEGFEVKPLETGRLGDLADLAMVMVFDPEELSEEALFRLDQYVMGGGKLFVATAGIDIDLNSGQATSAPPNINSLLEYYGLKINADVLEDWGRGATQLVMTQRGPVPLVNPFIMEVADLDKESAITKDMGQLLFYFPSSVSESTGGTSGTVKVLAKSSANTRKQEQFFNLEHDRLRPPPKGDKSLRSHNLVMSVSGELNSRFAVADPPVLTNDDGTTRAVVASEVVTKSKPEAEVVVVGSGFSFFSQVLRGNGIINGLFLLNVADTLTRGGDLVSLRSKFTENPKLRPDLEADTKLWAQVLVVGAVPALLVVLGLARLYWNRARRASYAARYGGVQANAAVKG